MGYSIIVGDAIGRGACGVVCGGSGNSSTSAGRASASCTDSAGSDSTGAPLSCGLGVVVTCVSSVSVAIPV